MGLQEGDRSQLNRSVLHIPVTTTCKETKEDPRPSSSSSAVSVCLAEHPLTTPPRERRVTGRDITRAERLEPTRRSWPVSRADTQRDSGRRWVPWPGPAPPERTLLTLRDAQFRERFYSDGSTNR
ncbi:hypothetical protein AAFF_G00068930 [Aldrovandia affinis]|uniref:Uncharacterized protein n=1 Tax=Aldrovandia affinis TaxID=143900 RepID=A0AAD7RZ55_9TELE|nr:hypothetical protein AAFF_G00068930 [Aldrovandia affinis]